MSPRLSLSQRRPLADSLVSVVLPVFNEAAALRKLVQLVEAALHTAGCRWELVVVNDGSRDESGEILDDLAAHHDHLRVVHLSRNFGHQAAVQAGLLHASGDAIVVMDSDLQDDPAALPRLLEHWQRGYDVVYAVRVKRKEAWWKRMLFSGFYRVLDAVAHHGMPRDAGNFGLIDRRVAVQIAHLIDRDRFFAGLRHWVGFRQIGIEVERLGRHDERPRVSLMGLIRLAKTAIFSFSSFPLTMFYGIATLSMSICLAIVVFTLYHKFHGNAVPGWTSITITASLFGALNALGIGILGEYAIRIYDQVRARPMFVVARKVNLQQVERSMVAAHLNWPGDTWTDASDPLPLVTLHASSSRISSSA